MRVKSLVLLREYVEAAGLSGRALARKAGLGQAIVGHLLSGRRTTCSSETASRIEAALQAPTGLLFATETVRASDEAVA